MSEILSKLISYNDVQVGILAIHGLDRIGKSTLAQLIWNELEKKRRFNMTLWVQASYEYDLEKVTRLVLDSMGEPHIGDINLDIAQKLIQGKFEGKRYLLVLDNFSKEKKSKLVDWVKFIRPLQKGAPGSVIIVMTNITFVPHPMSTISSYHLKKLS